MANDDEAWRAIVDNFGERADLDGDRDLDDPDPQPAAEPVGSVAPPPSPASARTCDEDSIDSDWSQDRFIPPPPPPVPATTKDRKLAWFGVFGSPAILLLSLVLGIGLPSFIVTLLVVSFVGGFVYLVLLMPRGPRDPDDNGAVL